MSTEAATMVPVHETPGPMVDEYLLHYLLTETSTPVAEAEQISAEAAAALLLTAEMVAEFSVRLPWYLLLQDYYEGNPPLAMNPKRLTRIYRELLLMARSNWCGLVVDVVDERLSISSIASTQNPTKDETAWNWWQANNMDGLSAQIHQSALKFGCCYLSAWPNGPKGAPKMMGESPLSTYVRFDSETEEPIAAIRVSRPECCPEIVFVDLTTPAFQFRLTGEGAQQTPRDMAWLHKQNSLWGMDYSRVQWRFRDDVMPVARNPLGEVPYVRMRTMPDLCGGHRSEIEGILPIQDRINKTNFDRLVAQEFAAFPQRWATGIDVPRDPKTGKLREPFDAAVDRVWTAAAPDARMGAFPVAETRNYLEASTHDTQALATQSRTPPHYLVAGMGHFPSGESVRATEYGLTRKVQARQQSYGDAYQQYLRLCARVAGDKRLADDYSLNVVWANVQARSEGEIVDALMKMASLNVPVTALWARWGATPEEIEDWEAQRQAELAKQAAALATTEGKGTPLLPSVDLNPSVAVAGVQPQNPRLKEPRK